MFVSIFMASSTSSMSPTCKLCPGCASTRTTLPETGLRQTFSSFDRAARCRSRSRRGSGRQADRCRLNRISARRHGRSFGFGCFHIHFVSLLIYRDLQFHG